MHPSAWVREPGTLVVPEPWWCGEGKISVLGLASAHVKAFSSSRLRDMWQSYSLVRGWDQSMDKGGTRTSTSISSSQTRLCPQWTPLGLWDSLLPPASVVGEEARL